MSVAGLSLDVRTVRAYAPLVVFVATIAAGWMVVVRPIASEQSRASGQLETLRQREWALRGEVGKPSPRGIDIDPAVTFERQLATGDVAPALLEQLARLASAARARNLLIETVEAGQTSAPKAGRDDAAQRDPRFALFDIPVSHVAIRVAFDTDYASLGRFLWAFRNLPTTVEIRALTVGLPPAESEDEDSRSGADVLRASLTLHAYSRTTSTALHASNTVAR
jgi:hypothetical protein